MSPPSHWLDSDTIEQLILSEVPPPSASLPLTQHVKAVGRAALRHSWVVWSLDEIQPAVTLLTIRRLGGLRWYTCPISLEIADASWLDHMLDRANDRVPVLR